MKVYHCASKDEWKEPKDENQTWEQYWVAHSGVEFDGICRDCKEKSNDIVGAHVRKLDSTDMCVYIVPTCRSCNSAAANSKEKHIFDVPVNELVPANVDRLDEEDEYIKKLAKSMGFVD